MSTGTRIRLADAEVVARSLVVELAVGCERIEIAGSIRRQADDVGDIELVAIPRVVTRREQDGLFGEHEVEVDELRVAIDNLILAGTLAPHPGDPKQGQRYAKLLHRESGLQLDLFAVRPPAQWGVIFLIRTGPAHFSQWFVTEARRRAHHVVDGALHRGALGCGSIPCDLVSTPEERDVFEALNIAYRPPVLRGKGNWT